MMKLSTTRRLHWFQLGTAVSQAQLRLAWPLSRTVLLQYITLDLILIADY